ncbi:DUF2336 domain-containing protein [Bradyrhizobium japonicum]|uniref:DUF2336 domain-containing protein n=1 Tax=Bradyrhizobium japonicum TaxID=375 RepID=UPI0027150D55|nr:DUF2336 domain-containing protein [Bradyrhizobium japonicum]WLB23993.1 DUF2336 domain-containing protein [Bradyrhizobium japonicum]
MPVSRFEARLSDLEDAYIRCSSARRAEILRQVLGSFVVEQRHCDVVALDEVLLRLSRPAEAPELRELSKAVVNSELPLSKSTHQLAKSKDPTVACPVLRTSRHISEQFLREVAETSDQEYLLAISARSKVSAAVVTILVKRGNAAVKKCLSANDGTQIPESSFSVLLKLAERDEDLAAALATRSDVPSANLRRFLNFASPAAKARFIASASPATCSLLSEIAASPPLSKMEKPLDYSTTLSQLQILGKTGKLGDASFGRFILNGQTEMIVAGLSMLAGIDIKEAQKVFFTGGAEVLALACKAARLRWATAVAILRSRAGSSELSERDIDETRKLFESVSLSDAQRHIRYGGDQAKSLTPSGR